MQRFLMLVLLMLPFQYLVDILYMYSVLTSELAFLLRSEFQCLPMALLKVKWFYTLPLS